MDLTNEIVDAAVHRVRVLRGMPPVMDEAAFDRVMSGIPDKDPSFAYLANTVSNLMKARDESKDHAGRRDDALPQLIECKSELDDLKTNPKKAYENLRRLTDQLNEERVRAEKELQDIVDALHLATPTAAAGGKSLEVSEWGKATIAVAFTLAIAAAMLYLVLTVGGKAPDTALDITYDIGAVMQALLVGSGALIAGIAYAIDTVRRPQARQ